MKINKKEKKIDVNQNLTNSKDIITSKYKKYEVIKQIGRGTFGNVYLCNSDGKKVVLKEIQIKDSAIFNGGKCWKTEVEKEYCIQNKFESENIVKVYESFDKSDRLFIAMEYCNNGNLNEFLRDNINLDIISIFNFFEQLVNGLNEIHSKCILHRDIKTLNIFIKDKKTVKIGDFGSSKILNEKLFTNTIIGTPFYLCPEICDESYYTYKSDIWCLGIVLYEMLTGTYPFKANNLEALKIKIKKEEVILDTKNIRCFKEVNSEINSDNFKIKILEFLKSLTFKLLYKNPDKRPTIQELKDKVVEFNGNIKILNDNFPTYIDSNKDINGNHKFDYYKKNKNLLLDELQKKIDLKIEKNEVKNEVEIFKNFKIDDHITKEKSSDINKFDKHCVFRPVTVNSKRKNIKETNKSKSKYLKPKLNQKFDLPSSYIKDEMRINFFNINNNKNNQLRNIFEDTNENLNIFSKINKIEIIDKEENLISSKDYNYNGIKNLNKVDCKENILDTVNNIESNIKSTNFFLKDRKEKDLIKLREKIIDLIGVELFCLIDDLYEELSLNTTDLKDQSKLLPYSLSLINDIEKSKLFFQLYEQLKTLQLDYEPL